MQNHTMVTLYYSVIFLCLFQVRHIDEILAEVGPGESNKDEEEEEGWEDVESSGEEDENGDGEDGKMDETWLGNERFSV